MNRLTEVEKAEFAKAMKELEKAEFAKAMEEMDKTFEKVDKMVDKIIKVFEPDQVEDYEDPTEVI